MDDLLLDALGEGHGHDDHCGHVGYDLLVVRVAHCFAHLVGLQLGLLESLGCFALLVVA